VSTPAPPAQPPAPRTIPCPRCNATIGPEQDWCLVCGAPARTRLAPLPNWRLPVALIGALALAAIIALIIAFVSLTSDDSTITGTTTLTAPATTPVVPATGPTGPTGLSVTPTVTTPPPTVTSTPPALTVPNSVTTAP
jgi:hypothetical protein